MANSPETHAVNLFLNGGRVTSGFRSSLFDAANRAGMSVNEFVITAAAEKLMQRGTEFPGVFRKGDLSPTCDRARAA
ncbi:hypothetical protein [Aurantimonas sp. A3-2-R12]|uniref:hypothetical protein n=1 Tax=Aurantimonas sp. A3-2-R12 TaxID=3114362 RepID=UPI002E18F101|nr:hypothetical protein [Aurantimonas sp. A3-2-R12]